MNSIAIIRAQHWWHSVLAFLMGISYLFLFYFGIKFETAIWVVTCVFVLIVITASTGYIINNLTDLTEDIQSGKKAYKLKQGIYLLAFLIIIHSFVIYFFSYIHAGFWSYFFYISQLSCFVLYSVNPFRLKKYPIASIILDSLYNSTLFSFFILSFFTNIQYLNPILLIIFFLWLWLRGIKNYLIHLCDDRHYDYKAKKNTLVLMIGINKSIKIIIFLLLSECVLFGYMLFNVNYIMSFIFFAFIFFISIEQIFFPIYKGQFKRIPAKSRFILNDFYENIFPLVILVFLSLHDARYAFIIPVHILFFPNVIIKFFEYFYFFRNQFKSLASKCIRN